jgi:glutamate formiminotransferase/formiminotetrahydrofolate cyclodeaminase
MVARLTIGRKKYAKVEPQMKDVAARADALRLALTAAIDADSAAFEAVMAAMRLPKDTPEQKAAREREMQLATQHATEIPLAAARTCVDVLELVRDAAAHGNVNVMSDVATAAHMARAAIESAGINVRINAPSLNDKEQAHKFVEESNALRARAEALTGQALADVEKRATLA